jgi:hypothetical protein
MPAPDPHAINLGDGWPARICVTFEQDFWGGSTHRKARALRILRNLYRGGWVCRHCGDPVQIYRRADAVFCSEGCRKRAARQRRDISGPYARARVKPDF